MIPDMADAVIAWRSWSWAQNYDELSLVSPVRHMLWTPKEKARAYCPHNVVERKSCHCGINAFRDLEHLQQRNYGNMPIIGEVYLWGEVQEYERGFRGQFAYPASFYASSASLESDVKELAELFGAVYKGILERPAQLELFPSHNPLVPHVSTLGSKPHKHMPHLPF